MWDLTLHVIVEKLVFLSNKMENKGVKVEISKMQYIPSSFSPWMTQRGMCEDIIDRP